MPGPTTEVLSEDLKDLKTDVHRIDVSLAELRSDVKNAVGVARWLVTALFGVIIAGAVSSVWWASSVNTEIKHLGGEVAEIKQVVESLPRFTTIKQDLPPQADPRP